VKAYNLNKIASFKKKRLGYETIIIKLIYNKINHEKNNCKKTIVKEFTYNATMYNAYTCKAIIHGYTYTKNTFKYNSSKFTLFY
jgi:hypothetical protein